MIKDITLKTLQKAIEQTLRLDPSRQEKISSLEGKSLKIIVAPLDISFYIFFHHNKLNLSAHYENEVDAVIRSNPIGLIRLSLLPASKARSLFNDEIKITGDVTLGQEVKNLFDELDIDWEGHLARFTGDVIAHQVGSFVRRGIEFKTQARQMLKRNLSDYLQEELKFLPPQEEMEDFYKDIDRLRLDVERLEAHINLLLAHNEKN